MAKFIELHLVESQDHDSVTTNPISINIDKIVAFAPGPDVSCLIWTDDEPDNELIVAEPYSIVWKMIGGSSNDDQV